MKSDSRGLVAGAKCRIIIKVEGRGSNGCRRHESAAKRRCGARWGHWKLHMKLYNLVIATINLNLKRWKDEIMCRSRNSNCPFTTLICESMQWSLVYHKWTFMWCFTYLAYIGWCAVSLCHWTITLEVQSLNNTQDKDLQWLEFLPQCLSDKIDNALLNKLGEICPETWERGRVEPASWEFLLTAW